MPQVFLMLLLYPITSAIGRFIVGAGVAVAVYMILTSMIRPVMTVLDQKIIDIVGGVGSSGATVAQTVQYLDLPGLCVIILSAYSAAMSIKILSVSLKAFSVRT